VPDTPYEPPVVQQPGRAVPHATDEAEQDGGSSQPSSPWNPLALLSEAVRPTVQAGRANDQTAQPSGQIDFSPGGRLADNPMVEQTIRKIKDSPDPVLEVVNMISGGLDNVRSGRVYQTVYGDYQLLMSRDHSTRDKLVDKSIGAFSSGPVTMDRDFGMRVSLRPDNRGGAILQLSDFSGVHPSVEGPLKNRGVRAGGVSIFKGNDGDYHASASGQAAWGLRRVHWTKPRNITIGPENITDPYLASMMREATDIDRALADLLKIQQSKDVLSVGIQRAHAAVPGTDQFDMHVKTRTEKHVPLNQELNTGIPLKVESLDLGTNVSASLSYSRDAGVALSNIRGVKINVETFGGKLKQVVSPTKLTFSRDAAGKAVVGVEFAMHDGEGKPGAPVSFSIPFSKIINELGKRKR